VAPAAAPASESLEVPTTTAAASTTAESTTAASPSSISSDHLRLSYLHSAVASQFSYFERAVPLLDASDDRDLVSHACAYL
jgi:hypothetical protein